MHRSILAVIAIGVPLMCMNDTGLSAEKHWPPLPLPKIACRGTEECGRFVEDNPGWGPHMPTLFLAAKNPDVAWQTPQEHVDWANDPLHSYVADGTGALTVIAHPGQWDDEYMATLKGLTGVEIAHGRDFSRACNGRWDRALTARIKAGLPPVWGFAADDTHSSKRSDRCWFAARLAKLTERDLKEALRNGNFYASTGPVITDIQVDGPTITVKVGQKSNIRWLKSGQYCMDTKYGVQPGVVSRDPGRSRCLKLDKNVTTSSYTLNDADGTTNPGKALFVRCVVSADERAAMTQPFVIRSTKAVANPYAATGKWYKGTSHNHVDALPGYSPERIRNYHGDYAAKGHACAFETGYDYWVVPMQRYPPDRTPLIQRVEPLRIAAGKAVEMSLRGRAFGPGARVLIDGRDVPQSRASGSDLIKFTTPAALAVGGHTVTVRNDNGFQDTRQYAFVVQKSLSVNDGWTHFTPDNSRLGSGQTYAVAADGGDGVWVATNHGLNHFDGRTWKLYRKGPDGMPAETFYDVAVDADGNAWFTCFRAVGVVAKGGGPVRKWLSLDPEGSRKYRFPGKQINQILLRGGEAFVTIFSRPGLFVFRDGKWSPVKVGLPNGAKITFHGLTMGPAGRMWMGSNAGVICWEPSKGDSGWKRYHTGNSSLPDDYVLRVAFDKRGRLWAATATRHEGPDGGLACLDNGKWTVYSPTNSPLPERRVWSVFPDRRGNVWAATGKGVACLRADGSWRVYTTTNSGLADNLVTDICQDRQGNLWFTTAGGVARLDADAVATSGVKAP